jgi:hypothetical protein
MATCKCVCFQRSKTNKNTPLGGEKGPHVLWLQSLCCGIEPTHISTNRFARCAKLRPCEGTRGGKFPCGPIKGVFRTNNTITPAQSLRVDGARVTLCDVCTYVYICIQTELYLNVNALRVAAQAEWKNKALCWMWSNALSLSFTRCIYGG